MSQRFSITNPEPAGGRPLVVQGFYIDPNGVADDAPFETRALFPGVTTILSAGEGKAWVIQAAPTEAVAALAATEPS